jgi:hypothetical protein
MAPAFRTERSRLSWLASDIAAQVGTWSTPVHRRLFATTLFYHASDLPGDMRKHLAPFDAFAKRIRGQLPPPLSHVRHWHWLSALQAYWRDMAHGGAQGIIELLDDPRNDAVPLVPTMPDRWVDRAQHTPAPSAPASDGRERHRLRIGDIVKDQLPHLEHDAIPAVDMLYIGDVEDYAPAPLPNWRVVPYGNPSGPDERHDFNVAIPGRLLESSGADVLLVCAGIGFYAVWDRLEQDLDAFLTHRRRVILVFIREGFEPLPFVTHAYMLSLLIRRFPRRKFKTLVTIYDPTMPATRNGTQSPGLDDMARQSARRLERTLQAIYGAERPMRPPEHFSALIFTVEANQGGSRRRTLAQLLGWTPREPAPWTVTG